MDSNTQQINDERIHFFDILGLSDEELRQYIVRLNTNTWLDLETMYQFNRQDMMDWIFVKKWPDNARSVNHCDAARKILQFIQYGDPAARQWVFIGAYDITGQHTCDDGTVMYDYAEIPEFAQFNGRCIVNYTKKQGFDPQLMNNLDNDVVRQRFRNTMILDHITAKPLSIRRFPGFGNVRLNHSQLVSAVEDPEWQAALGSVQAVYLQTDTRTGWHYVGSAYSQNGQFQGLLSRWRDYAFGDHSGGNAHLKELGAKYIEDNFQYSILEIFNMATLPQDIIQREHWWMDTLSSVYRSKADMPHGYNSVAEREADDKATE